MPVNSCKSDSILLFSILKYVRVQLNPGSVRTDWNFI